MAKKKKNRKKMPDVVLDDVGTAVIFSLLTARAREWWEDNVITEAWQWLGGRKVSVSHDYASDITRALRRKGFRVR